MKKQFAAIVAVFLLQWSFAQAQSEDDLKAKKGNFLTELNFNPFRGNLSLNNALNQVKFRYFVNDDLALRFGVALNLLDSTMANGAPYGDNSYYRTSKTKQNGVDINIGFEKHFAGTRRLSPYVGVDLSWGVHQSRQNISNNSTSYEIKNGYLEMLYSPDMPGYHAVLKPSGYNRLGVSAVAGFDFYIAKNFFIGYEFNLGYSRLKYRTPEVESIGENGGIVDLLSNSSVTSFKTSLINGIRIGYAF